MNTTSLPAANPPTAAEEKQENKFERALADPDTPSPFHPNVYVRTFLGGLLFLGLILFYVTHLSGHTSLDNHSQAPNPAVDTHLEH
jgi:quinol-cytochrome oxidoreductase complex cytochrome b subunit